MKGGIAVATLIALSGGAMSANAADFNERGFYAGAGVGQFNVNIDDIDDTDDAIERLNDDDAAWKVYGGYRFNRYFSVEAAYIDFGSPSDKLNTSGSSGEYNVEFSGLAPYLIGTMPLGPVELYGKIGYYFYDVDLQVNLDLDDQGSNKISDSDDDFLYGFGVGMTFFEHLNARLEYEKIDASRVDEADALWLSGAWRF